VIHGVKGVVEPRFLPLLEEIRFDSEWAPPSVVRPPVRTAVLYAAEAGSTPARRTAGGPVPIPVLRGKESRVSCGLRSESRDKHTDLNRIGRST
jgi:hypothetical protein